MAPPATLVTKLKVQLKLAIARLRMVQKRDEALSKTARRDMAHLLEVGKVESARIRVENIIRSDITTELHELLELYCELLIARAGLMEGPTCDPGLEEAIKSIIYAAPKTEVKELQTVRALLGEKYGKEFVLAAMENSDSKVSEKVVKKLSVTPPREELVVGYLEEIAKTYNVDWPKRQPLGEPPDLLIDDLEEDSLEPALTAETNPSEKTDQDGDSKDASAKTDAPSSSRQQPAAPKTTDTPPPKPAPGPAETKAAAKTQEAPKKNGGGSKGPGGGVPDVAELERRFAALKKS